VIDYLPQKEFLHAITLQKKRHPQNENSNMDTLKNSFQERFCVPETVHINPQLDGF
jgi:hypothetical protein